MSVLGHECSRDKGPEQDHGWGDRGKAKVLGSRGRVGQNNQGSWQGRLGMERMRVRASRVLW